MPLRVDIGNKSVFFFNVVPFCSYIMYLSLAFLLISFPGSTPLHLAARGGSVDCIRKLLAWGADRHQRDSSGYCFTVFLNLYTSKQFVNFQNEFLLIANSLLVPKY